MVEFCCSFFAVSTASLSGGKPTDISGSPLALDFGSPDVWFVVTSKTFVSVEFTEVSVFTDSCSVVDCETLGFWQVAKVKIPKEVRISLCIIMLIFKGCRITRPKTLPGRP